MPTKAAVQPAPEGRAEKNQAKELENLQRVFEWLDKKGDKKIDASELMDHLRFLGCATACVREPRHRTHTLSLARSAQRDRPDPHVCRHKCTKADAEDMIWEVDEDCDRCVDWEEFKTMFYRVRHDKSGWEPRRLFTVVEFMMHDKDFSGTIDMDECMEILFRRFGKEQLESKVNEFMSQDEDGDSDITFTEFINMDLKSRRATRGTTPSDGESRGKRR